jgi:hypothetical protein
MVKEACYMEYSEVFETLKQHALNFHHVLKQGRVYSAEITETEFLARVDDRLSGRAKNVVQGIEGFELTRLSLPVGLIYSLFEVVPVATWDYEFSYARFFQDLEKLFSRTRYSFSWAYDARQSELHYSLDDQTWSIENLALTEDLDPIVYLEIHQKLSDYLSGRGQLLYDATTGDQTGMLILVPAGAATMLADYLIAVDDPRSEWFYTGIPEITE